MLSLVVAFAMKPLELYLGEDGNDLQQGRSHGTCVRTFGRVKELIRAARVKDASLFVCVNLHGTFRISQPIDCGPEYSNTSIEEESGSNAEITGNILLSGAKKDEFNGKPCWSVSVPPDVNPKQLFFRGKRLERPHLPESGFYQFSGYLNGDEKLEWNKGQTAMKFKPGDLRNWRNLDQVELVAHHLWVTSILPIKSIDEASGTVQFAKQSVFKLADDYTGGASPYTVENVAEAFGKPGQWYFDKSARRIYYVPFSNEKLKEWKPETPVSSTLFRVHDVNTFGLYGIKLTGTQFDYPADQSGDGQAAVSVPGAIQFSNCVNPMVGNCNISNLGTYAIELTSGCQQAYIDNCDMHDLGAGGVKIGHDTEQTIVLDCSIQHGGRIFAPAVGIWIGNGGNNSVINCDISDLFYTGISVGWTWGYGASKAINNKIEYNHIWNIGQNQLSDMGGIYTLGVSPGTVLRGNRIDNVQARGYGGWGIYTDEGSSGILIENNVVTNTKTGGFHQHYGKENIVRNNVFAYAAKDGQIIRSRQEDHTSFTFQHNVVLWKGTELLGGNWSNGHYDFGHNLLCREDGKVNLPGGDQGSVVVPSLKLDKNLMPPKDLAERIGFIPFDLSGVGRPQPFGDMIER